MNKKEFLQHFPKFCVQTFDDSPKGKKIELVSCGKPSNYTKERIAELQKNGAGIYFAPNQFPEGIRRAEKCTGVNAWIVDCDDESKEEQMKRIENSPLPPSFIIESKNGYHIYWLENKGTIENYRRIVKGLIQHFKADEACKDITRVLRIPEFYHQKDKDNPFLVKIIKENPENKYTDLQMLEAFPYEEKVITRQIKQATGNTFWEIIGSLDNKMVLERLSGKEIVNREQFTFRKRSPEGEYIDVNNVPADAWLDKDGMIGSGKRGGPTWIQWVGFYGRAKKEIAEWAKIYLSDYLTQFEEKEIKKQIEELSKPVIKKDYKLRYTWGTTELNNSFAIIKRKDFIVIGAKRSAGKTTYTFDMACKNALLGHKVLYLSLEMDVDEIKEDFARKYAGITIGEEYHYKIPEQKQKAMKRKIDEIENIKTLIFEGIRRGEGTTWRMIEVLIEKYEGLDMIFIDNLDLINGEQGEDNNDKQIRVTKKIMNFTANYQIPIVLIHHYRKGGQGKKDYGMDELGGSGKISDNADRVVKISRCQNPEAEYPEKYESVIHLQKARGYCEAMKTIYFIKGTFTDTPPLEEKQVEYSIDDIIKMI